MRKSLLSLFHLHRASLEQRLASSLSSLEKTAGAHREEQQRLVDQLTTQKQLASKYSDRVSELERESRLRGLELKEAKKELETEKSLASKLYDDVSNMHTVPAGNVGRGGEAVLSVEPHIHIK